MIHSEVFQVNCFKIHMSSWGLVRFFEQWRRKLVACSTFSSCNMSSSWPHPAQYANMLLIHSWILFTCSIISIFILQKRSCGHFQVCFLICSTMVFQTSEFFRHLKVSTIISFPCPWCTVPWQALAFIMLLQLPCYDVGEFQLQWPRVMESCMRKCQTTSQVFSYPCRLLPVWLRAFPGFLSSINFK